MSGTRLTSVRRGDTVRTMSDDDLVITGRRVVLPTGMRPASVHVAAGRIVAITDAADRGAGAVVDAGDLVVLPGFVDSHVHINEPGRTAWEGFATATVAAAAGGVTTLVDMPLNCVPPTTTPAALEEKRRVAAGQVSVDVGFWGGLVPGNLDHLEALVEAGVCGFKAFLVDSGVEEFGAVGVEGLAAGLRRLAALDALTIVHAEDAAVIAGAAGYLRSGPPTEYRVWLDSRPALAEELAVSRLAELSRELDARVHVLHVSAAGALDPLAVARARGTAISAETCPHYLALAAGEIPDGATACKCAPPIRDAANREKLWAALDDGVLSMVVSDHSPSPPQLKAPDTGDFTTAWGGIASLQIAPVVVWTAARARGHGPEALARWMAAEPARLAGLVGKGALAVGRDADVVLFDPDAEQVVHGADLHHRHPLTPYEGWTLTGQVRATFLRGRQVAADGDVEAGTGRLLIREAAMTTAGHPRGWRAADVRLTAQVTDRRVADDLVDLVDLVDLADRRLGGIVLAASDEYFAPKESLLEPNPPVFDPTAYTVRGKLMDGWESRRRRGPGSDWAVIRLGAPGVVRRVRVDTRHFRGNAPAAVSVDAAVVADLRDVPGDDAWYPLLARTAVMADHVNELDVADATLATHLRLWVHPDGGVARLRVLGDVVPDLCAAAGRDGALDLAALVNGALVTGSSGEFFSSRHNLIRLGDARDMGDGWETARRRGDGHDWVVVRLATVGVVDHVEIDTTHFRGNHPAACAVDARDDTGDGAWWPLLGRQRLGPHLRHRFAVDEPRPATHVRLRVFPDGGVARLRLPGRVSPLGAERAGVRRFNALPRRGAVAALLACCAATRWAEQVADRRPFADLDGLRAASMAVWWELDEADWDEAFAAHPRIGDRSGPAHTRREQAGTAAATAVTLEALEAGNHAYEARFGRVFLICATGKAADEMLAALQARLDTEPDAEVRTAAEEQSKITDRRLAAMVGVDRSDRRRTDGRAFDEEPRPEQ